MLLSFSFSNFRSFQEESSLNLVPANIREIPYSVLTQKADKHYKGLCSSVIYGANANGKSNALLAIEFLQQLVISGNINTQRCMPIPLAPNFHNKGVEPISFNIRFIYKQHLIEYTVSIGGVSFLGEFKDAFIEYEVLYVNSKPQFTRVKQKVDINYENTRLMNSANINIFEMQATESLLSDELFLTNGYKTLVNKDIYSIILEWFQTKLIVVRNVNYVSTTPKFDYDIISDKNEGGVLLSDGIINNIAKAAGIDTSEIHFEKSDKEAKPQAVSFIDGKGVVARFIESAGTMKMINFIPLVISVMVNGGTLIVDELDSSLHPSAVFSIVNAFHNDELNTKQAQLIFTSHNPIYQKAKIFRRDEIKFIEREDGVSKIYNLSDFGTSGENGVKNSTDIMKNYLNGSYGAIRFVDFSDVIREAIEFNFNNSGDSE
ncbi:MAG: ATP-binding protein [Roseburia sp.]|nr:ATP-binding protein [Roseburia sp.]